MRILFDAAKVTDRTHRSQPARGRNRVLHGVAQSQKGGLLRVAEERGFEVFITGDRTLIHEQNIAGRRLAIRAISRQEISGIEGRDLQSPVTTCG